MRKELVSRIIKENDLIPGKESRKILNAIIENKYHTLVQLPHGITYSQINELDFLYKKKLKDLGENKSPRYLPFYHIIKDRIPSFSWSENEFSYEKKIITLHQPRVQNIRPSLLSILLGRVKIENDTFLHRKYLNIKSLPENIIRDFDLFMKNNQIYYSPSTEMDEVINWIKKGLKGERLTIFSPICPDYANEKTGDLRCPIRYTFTQLGSGQGIIAHWVAQGLPFFIVMLKKWKIQFDVIIAMADFEGFSTENLKRFNLNEEEFFCRIKSSLHAFKEACPVEAKIIFFTELCGKNQWNLNYETMRDQLISGDYGSSVLNRNKLLEITGNRKALYQLWYGSRASLEAYVDVTVSQGVYYATMGKILLEKFSNCLIFAADNRVMRYFYSVPGCIPTLYLKKNYC